RACENAAAHVSNHLPGVIARDDRKVWCPLGCGSCPHEQAVEVDGVAGGAGRRGPCKLPWRLGKLGFKMWCPIRRSRCACGGEDVRLSCGFRELIGHEDHAASNRRNCPEEV